MHIVTNRTKTTIVNAAFLQDVKDENLRLWAIVRDLRSLRYAQHETREVSRQLVDLLSELRDSIALQFSLEETYGFIECAPHAPQFGAADAETAKAQHRELYLQLHEMVEQAEEAQYRGTIGRDLPIFVNAFEGFDASFRAHEELEQELIRCGLGISRFGPTTF